MDEQSLVKDELIGRNVRILQCTDPTFVNICGIIIDETKNTFLLENDDKQIRIAKNSAVFEIEYDQKKITIKGSRLLYRPEDRTKKAR
jgi:ribonuclease P protein subunit POP4